MAAVPPASQLQPQPQPQSQPHANGTSQQYAPKAASGDLLDLMGNMALEAEPSSGPSTSPSDLLALEAPPAATPPAPPADPADSLALALLDGGPTQVQVLISEPDLLLYKSPSKYSFCAISTRHLLKPMLGVHFVQEYVCHFYVLRVGTWSYWFDGRRK